MGLILPYRILIVLAMVAVAYAGGRWQQKHADALRAQEQQLAAVTAARAEEQRRAERQAEITNEAHEQAEKAQADARAAAAAADGLRRRIAQLVAASRKHPAAAHPGTAANDPIGVLADVLGRADQRAGELATYADAAHIAGSACERAYDALRTPR